MPAWESHVGDAEIAEARGVWRAIVAFLVIAALLIVGFFALLVIVLVTLAF